MTFVPKRLTVYSAELKEETTFGTENAPAAATDAFYLQYDSADVPEMVTEEFEFDGALGPNAVGFGPNMMVPKSGRIARIALGTYFRGAGAAYSVSVFPKNRFHLAMKMGGYVPTGDFTASSEKYTYVQAAPSVTPVSATGYFWAKQLEGESKMERVKALALVSNLKASCTNPRPAKFTFDAVGIFNAIGDETFTAPTLAAIPLPPLGSSLTFAYGSFSTATVYDWNFDLRRDLSTLRVALSSSGGFLGAVPGGYDPLFEVTIEQTKLSDWNAYDVRGLASTAALALTNGGTQYNRIKLNGPQAQLVDVKQANRGKIPQWKLSFHLPPSTPAATDSHNWVTD